MTAAECTSADDARRIRAQIRGKEGDIDAMKAWLAADPSRDVKALIASIRACGGRWTSYCRLPHKEVLRLRSLVSRGRALPVRKQRRRPRGSDGRQDCVVTFLCKLGDNGVVWKILEFWRATR